MEIFRNYIRNEPKKPLTMEDSWIKICTRWAHSLELSPVKELIALIDGKFFAAFMGKFLPWNSTSSTVTDTFKELEDGLRKEFPFGAVVRMSDAKAGHEEELVKLVTLLMYLAVVKHHNPSLADTLQDNKLFNKEVQLRFKCILQALMEQHAMLTPALLGEIIMSNVSETTGQLSAPVVRARLADRPSTRVGKPSPGSPVIFSSSGNNSPLKEFLDSPQTRQLATYQRMLEERNAQTRLLRTELETEKTERQFVVEEANRFKEQTRRLEVELSTLKQEMRDKAANVELSDSSLNEGEINQKYHLLVSEQKEQSKYLASVEQQLAEVAEEKSRLEARLQGVMEKLSAATDDKHRVEMTMEDMRLNLTETRSENSKLSENVEELQGQIEDLSQQLQFSFLSGGRKSMAPSVASFQFNPCDMTNVSVDADADDSVGAVSSSFGENMGDVVGQQQEERIDALVMEKSQLENEIQIEKEVRERTQVELQKEKAHKTEMFIKIEELGKVIESEKEEKSKIVEALETERIALDNERVEKSVLVMEVNKLRGENESQERKHEEENRKLTEVLSSINEQLNEKTIECETLTNEVNSCGEKIGQLKVELVSSEEVKGKLDTELDAEKKRVDIYERQLSQEKTRYSEEVASLSSQLENERKMMADNSQKLEEERISRAAIVKEMEEARVISEERNISQLAENKILSDSFEVLQKEKEDLALELVRYTEMLKLSETAVKEREQQYKEMMTQLETHEDIISKLNDSKREYEHKVAHSEREVASAVERLEALQKEKFEFMDKIDEIEGEKKVLGAEKTKLDSKVAGYEEHIKNFEAQIKEKEAKIEQLTNYMETQRNHHLNKDAELITANDKIGNLEKELVSKTQEVASLVQNQNRQSKESAVLNAAVEEKDLELATLRRDLEVRSLELQEKEQELEKRIEQLGAAGEQMGRLNAELAESKDNLENKELETKELETKLSDKQTELDKVVEEATLLGVTIESLSEKVQTHEQELIEKASSSDLKKQEFLSNIKELESKITDCEESNIDLRKQIDTLKDEAARCELKHQEECLTLNKNMTAYAEELREVRKQESELILEKKKLEAEILKVKVELEVKISGCEEHFKLKEDLQEQLKNKETEIENLKTENQQVFKFVEEKEETIKALENKIEALISEKEGAENDLVSLKERVEKEATLKGVQEDEVGKLQFLLEEVTAKLSGEEQEIVLMKEKHIAVEKELELLRVEKSSLAVDAQVHMDTIETLKADNKVLNEELDKVQEESKSMEEILEGIEQKRQELDIEKQRLHENLNEVGATCEKRGEEIKEHLNKISELQSKLESQDELTHKLDFLQSQIEEMDGEKDSLREELDKVIEEKKMLGKEQVVLQQSKQEESEKLEMSIKELTSEKEVLQLRNEEILEEKNKLTEKLMDAESKLDIQNEKLTEYEENVASMSTEMECLKVNKSEIELKIKEVTDSREKVEARSKKLEEELKTTNASKDTLASSVSQLITDTNELKEKIEFKSMEHEKEKMVFEREKQELKSAIQEKEETLLELENETKAKISVENELKKQVDKNNELQSCISMVQAEVDKLKHDLAAAEIRYTDLEQSTQENGVTEIKEALKAQKERYETNHKKIVDGQTEKYRAKLKEFARVTEEQIEKKNEEVKKIDEEKKQLTTKCESYKDKVSDIVSKMEENEKLNSEQLEVLHTKYNRSKEEMVKLQKKYEAAKALIQKLTEDKQNMESELESKAVGEVEILKRELAQVRTENRTLTNQLSYADTKLREVNKYEARPNTRSRENSLTQNSEKTSLDFRSRESISSIVRGDNVPRTSSRESLRRDSSSSSVRSRPSIPGRADRQSRQSTSNLDDSVFKLPGPNTPGRAKQGRTVSDSRMAALAASKYKPPSGSGSLFHCDEEAGEMFSSSYLTDLKDGVCDITDNSRMSELARRNSLYPAHLKSAYPIESQFCEDEDITEDAIRFSKIGRPSDFTAPSPVTRLSQAASNLSLESPASSTRSKKSITQSLSSDQKTKVPPPTAFTIDPPKPGTAVRKSAETRATVKFSSARTSSTTSMASRTSNSSIGSLSRARPARPPRPVKQACVGEHGAKKKVCEEEHDDLENLPVDDPVSRYLSEGDQSAYTPSGRGRKRKSLGPLTAQPAVQEDLDTSQDSLSSSFSRSSLRSSKRLKGGNISYTRPGPPTPGRNKSLGNLSLPRTNNTSVTSLETTTSYPGVSSNTPDMSRVSTRSVASLKTPLLDSTNTPNKSKNQSKLSKMTPLGIRKLVGSAFR